VDLPLKQPPDNQHWVKTGKAQGERMLSSCPRKRTSDLRVNGYLIVGLCFVCAILLLHFSRKDHTLQDVFGKLGFVIAPGPSFSRHAP
jgi:hypothetical protein